MTPCHRSSIFFAGEGAQAAAAAPAQAGTQQEGAQEPAAAAPSPKELILQLMLPTSVDANMSLARVKMLLGY